MDLPMETVKRPIVSLSRALLASVILLSTVLLGVGSVVTTAGAETPVGVPVMDRVSSTPPS